MTKRKGRDRRRYLKRKYITTIYNGYDITKLKNFLIELKYFNFNKITKKIYSEKTVIKILNYKFIKWNKYNICEIQSIKCHNHNYFIFILCDDIKYINGYKSNYYNSFSYGYHKMYQYDIQLAKINKILTIQDALITKINYGV